MAHFYGYLSGNRGTTTRCGSKNSGINARIKSWNNDVTASLHDNEGKDELSITTTTGLKVFVNGKEYTPTERD